MGWDSKWVAFGPKGKMGEKNVRHKRKLRITGNGNATKRDKKELYLFLLFSEARKSECKKENKLFYFILFFIISYLIKKNY